MGLLLLGVGAFIVGYYVVKYAVLAIFGVFDHEQKHVDRSTTVIHNHYTTNNNHLHIDKDDAEKLRK